MPGEYPLGDMGPWVMTDHRTGRYAREASCRAGETRPKGRYDRRPENGSPDVVDRTRPDRR
jgi:hypothetical protein